VELSLQRGRGSVGLINPEVATLPTDPMLHHMPDDPEELNDVVDANQGLARDIVERYASWLKEIGAPEEIVAGRSKLR
jgi:hypothetical protein